MTIDEGSTYFLAFIFFSKGDKLSSTTFTAFRENNIE